MASRGQYLLRIGGRFEGHLDQQAVLQALDGLFDEPRGAGQGVPGELDTGGWPDGFILRDYIRCQWQRTIDYPHPDQTMISFRAEIHHTFPNSLYQNRVEMLRHVHWFYHYREYRWWRELMERLEARNKALRTKFKQDCPPERLWFRDWQWYCGNGGC